MRTASTAEGARRRSDKTPTMNWKRESIRIVVIVVVFLACYFLPPAWLEFGGPVAEALRLVRWYARQNVLLVLVPAFLIAGAITSFVSKTSVMKYLGAGANKLLAYGVAGISGAVMAVCSCMVLPLFAGIYRMGAGIGPATAFLYSGPAINVLAIILTARVLGPRLGLARAIGAVAFSVIIGLCMHWIHGRGKRDIAHAPAMLPQEMPTRPLWKNAVFFAAMVSILVFANWARSGDVRAVFLCCPGGLETLSVEGSVVERSDKSLVIAAGDEEEVEIPADRLRAIEPVEKNAVYELLYDVRWWIVAAVTIALVAMIFKWFKPGEIGEWTFNSWSYARMILPLLLIGVLVSGLLFGQGGKEGLIPSRYVEMLLGDRPDMFLDTTGLSGSFVESFVRFAWTFWSNFFAAVAGSLMYFATLTEVPIVQGLMGSGMGEGPALSLLLAGPAVSLPSVLVIRSVMGTRKTLTYVLLVVIMATLTGMLFGAMIG